MSFEGPNKIKADSVEKPAHPEVVAAVIEAYRSEAYRLQEQGVTPEQVAESVLLNLNTDPGIKFLLETEGVGALDKDEILNIVEAWS